MTHPATPSRHTLIASHQPTHVHGPSGNGGRAPSRPHNAFAALLGMIAPLVVTAPAWAADGEPAPVADAGSPPEAAAPIEPRVNEPSSAGPGSPPEEVAPPGGDDNASSASGATKLKEVVVTAQRREESVENVPAPVSVLSGDNLTDSGIGRSTKEVLDYVPNASAATQGHGRPRWWIRGIGTGQQQLDFSNPIGFYQDSVYISNASATGFPLFDLDRVEILRGPQGTLWGKNTTGGAINVVSRQPDFTPDGYLKFDYGTYDDKIAEAGFGNKVWGDKIAARASFHYEDRGARFTNSFTGRKEGQIQDGAARLQLLAKPFANLEALLNVHLRQYSTAGTTWTVTGSGPGGAYLNGYIPNADRDSVSSNAPSSDNLNQTGTLLSLKWTLAKLTLTSISAYENYRDEAFSDSDYTPLEVSRSWTKARSAQFTQELQVASPREDRWNWVAGLFYFDERINQRSSSAKLPGLASAAPGPANFSNSLFDHDTTSFAAFGSTTVNVFDAFSVTAGLRWTAEKRKLNLTRQATAPTADAAFSDIAQWWLPTSVATPLSDTFTASPERSWSNLTYDVTPQLELAKNARVYFRFAHGVKSGGFNTAATSAAALNAVEPEKLDDFELGSKTSWLNGRVVLNASAFYYRYRDIQVNVVGPLPPTNTAVSYLQNVKAGRVYGAELELDSAPVSTLHVGGSLGLLDTKFTNFQVSNNGPNYSGNEFVRSPHVSTLLRADYRFPVAEKTKVIVGADWRYQSKQFHFTTNQDNPLLGQGAYSIVNARIALASSDEKATLTFYANNLLDTQFRNHTLPAARNATGAPTQWADPRTFGVSLATRWW